MNEENTYSQNLVWIKRFKKTELFGLCCFLFFLPTMEFPKNVGVIIFYISGIIWRFLDKKSDWRMPDIFECILLFMCFSSLVSTLLNFSYCSDVKGFRDTVTFSLIAFLAYKNNNNNQELKLIIIVFILGLIFASCLALFEWYKGYNQFPEFHTGGFTRGATYLAISIFLLVGILSDNSFLSNKNVNSFIFLCVILFLLLLSIKGCRSSVVGLVTAMILLVGKFYQNKRLLFILSAILFSMVFIGLVFLTTTKESHTKFTNRFYHMFGNLSIKNYDSIKVNLTGSDKMRISFWLIGYKQAVSGEKFFFGVGPNNFKSINYKNYFDVPFIKKYALRQPDHAHNIFLTKLVEEGFLGFTALLFFVVYTTVQFYRFPPPYYDINWVWIGGFGAIIISLCAGMFDDSLRFNLGWFTMFLIGLGLGKIKKETQKA